MTIENVGHAFAVVKEVQADGLGWSDDYRPLGRTALARLLEERMANATSNGWPSWARRIAANGSYARQLLTALGAIELCVPRTRRFSAGSIESTFTALEGQAVRHWFARQVGKSIVIVVRTGDARIHRP